MSNTIATISKQQLQSECQQNNVRQSSTEEHVRYMDQRNGNIVIETYSDYFKYNGGSDKSNNELDTFVPAFKL